LFCYLFSILSPEEPFISLSSIKFNPLNSSERSSNYEEGFHLVLGGVIN